MAVPETCPPMFADLQKHSRQQLYFAVFDVAVLAETRYAMRHILDRPCHSVPSFEAFILRLMILGLAQDTRRRSYRSTAPWFLELDEDPCSDSIRSFPEALQVRLCTDFPCKILCNQHHEASRWAVHLMTRCEVSVEVAMLCALDREEMGNSITIHGDELARAV